MFSKTRKIKSQSPDAESSPAKLPAGAEAALWSIVEVIPDPRNHLALTKDPTAEVRLTRAAIDEAMARAVTPAAQGAAPTASSAAPAPRPVATAPEAAPTSNGASWLPDELPPVAEPRPAPATPRSDGVRWSADTAEVRLPSLSAPQSAAAPTEPGDASVHSIEPATPPASPLELPVQRRYARGA